MNSTQEVSISKTREAMISFRSSCCPACKKTKKPNQSLCRGCWKRLPRETGEALYLRFGEGYEEAWYFALTCLGITVPYMPDPPPHRLVAADPNP